MFNIVLILGIFSDNQRLALNRKYSKLIQPGVAKVVDIDPLRVHGVDRDLGVEWKSINSKIECEL
ncbi:hypothetical protein T4B_3255 [Trichinella pseudospiralis]|uniref:Uncharacterized protein n=1 Tax=Trichinella pseudospiralis TaxID=6337 RepID=A0A0V1GKV4_TRIPS|nr:hypothetical protein T4B_3255 [Trichinella pseudospiralis]KRY98874.1 hypothetical protein T4C_8580 [Trichinella pseudospiralis]